MMHPNLLALTSSSGITKQHYKPRGFYSIHPAPPTHPPHRARSSGYGLVHFRSVFDIANYGSPTFGRPTKASSTGSSRPGAGIRDSFSSPASTSPSSSVLHQACVGVSHGCIKDNEPRGTNEEGMDRGQRAINHEYTHTHTAERTSDCCGNANRRKTNRAAFFFGIHVLPTKKIDVVKIRSTRDTVLVTAKNINMRLVRVKYEQKGLQVCFLFSSSTPCLVAQYLKP